MVMSPILICLICFPPKNCWAERNGRHSVVQEGRRFRERALCRGGQFREVRFLTPNQTSISTCKRDTLRSRWVSDRTGESRNDGRSEEHTSELQSPDHLVCRLLLEKKKTNRPDRKSPGLL